MSTSAGAILIINGYPGVGKRTTAAELAKLLPNARVVDTSLLDAVAGGLFDKSKLREKEGYAGVQRALRDALLSTLADPTLRPPLSAASTTTTSFSATSSQPIYILTETQPSTTSGLALLRAYASFGASNKFDVIHFVLSCSTEINVQRLLSSSSSSSSHGGGNGAAAGAGRSGLDDLGLSLREMRMEDDIAHFGPLARRSGLAGEYELDTSSLGPAQTAGMMGEYTLDLLREKWWWIQLNRVK